MTDPDDALLPALDDALAALEAGASLSQALAADPAQAAELRPLLVAALAAGAGADLPRVPAGAQIFSRAQFLAAADRRPALAPVPAPGRGSRLRAWLTGQSAAGTSLLARAVAVSLVVLAGLSAGGYGAVVASAQSLPGDALYEVKRTVERTELLLTTDAQSRERLQTEFDDRRVREAQAVVNQGRQVAVDFAGTLISLNGDQGQHWLVSGIAVLVAPQVPVSGQPVVGARVRIQGTVQIAGLVQAQRVTVLAGAATPVTATASPTNPPEATEAAGEIDTEQPRPTPAAGTPEATSVELEATDTNPPPEATMAPPPTEDHGGSPEATHTPEPTSGGGDDHGGSATRTPKSTEVDDHGGYATRTPVPTQGGEHSGGTHTPEPTEDGHSGGGSTPTYTPQPTSSGGGPTPSKTTRPDN